MPSSGAPVNNGDESNRYSSLAALSAKNSLKRSRILYAVNPQMAFIPTSDPVILQNSIDRRKRQVIRHQIDHRQKSESDGTLAIVAATGGSSTNNSTLQMKPLSSSALIIQNNNTGKDDTKKKIRNSDSKGGSILVVSFWYLFVHICGYNCIRDSSYCNVSRLILVFLFPQPILIILLYTLFFTEIQQLFIESSQDTYPYMACTLEIVDCFVVAFGMYPTLSLE